MATGQLAAFLSCGPRSVTLRILFSSRPTRKTYKAGPYTFVKILILDNFSTEFSRAIEMDRTDLIYLLLLWISALNRIWELPGFYVRGHNMATIS